MSKFLNVFFCVLAFAAFAQPAGAADPVPISAIPVSDGIYMLMGRGGNLAVSTGADGTFVVDDQYSSQYDVIRQAITDLPAPPVKFLINTHWHSDHTGSNEQMGEAGAIIVAHDNVRQRLSTDQVIEFFQSETPASPRVALPIITFTRDLRFHLNGDDVHVFHVENAHTDGDAVVHFTRANVIHTGDVFFNERYPFIDAGSGGTVGGVIAAVDRILALADENTRIIPGHGPLTDRKGLQAYREMLHSVERAVAQSIVSGNSVEQVILAKPTKAFDTKWGDGFIKADTFVKMVFDAIQRATLN